MGTCRAPHFLWTCVGLFLVLSPISIQGQQGVSIIFTETPPSITSTTSATLRFNLVSANGSDSCDQCSIQCKLDQNRFQDCQSREDSFVNLIDGRHVFAVSVNTSYGAHFSSQYGWTVDTVSPTASIDAGPAFTNVVNATVNITFSEICDGNGGFVCSSSSSCDLLVYGAAAVIPSTLKEIVRGLVYSVQVGLSTQIEAGRAQIVMARSSCTDAAGNLFQRSEKSSFTIHFDRTTPSVNLWTAIPESQVVIGNQSRTIQATNKLAKLRIYLDFSQPVLNSTEELLSVLRVSSGNLTTTERRSFGNRRFGYLLRNITGVAVVSVILPGNSAISRYGSTVAQTSNTTFLYVSLFRARSLPLNSKQTQRGKGDCKCPLCGQPEDNIHFLIHCPGYPHQRHTLFKSIKGIVPVPLLTNFENLKAEPKAQALLGSSYWANHTQQINVCVKRSLEDIWKTRFNCLFQDRRRPQVQLSTTALSLTKDHSVPVAIQFTEPVFLFESSDITITGGNIRSFKEVSKSTYAMVLYVMDNTMVAVSVAENQTSDISGNFNLASPILQVRNYDNTPAVSVVLYSFTTAGLLATALASGALSVSSATLAAAGALLGQASGYVVADPSRNLLGMLGHLQIFALSYWLDVSLPIEYRETVRGLQWVIPHASTPWQRHDEQSFNSTSNFRTNIVANRTAILPESNKGRRGLRAVDTSLARDRYHQKKPCQFPKRLIRWRWRRKGGNRSRCAVYTLSNCSSRTFSPDKLSLVGRTNNSKRRPELNDFTYRARRLGDNTIQYGPALGASEYMLYFVDHSSNAQELKSVLDTSNYTGWQDFERNMFWLGVVGGGLLLLHIVTLLFLRWRMRTSLRGALSFPRFELFVLIFALPSMCQAAAFIIRGGTVVGIIVGVLVLSIPSSFVITVAMFLTYAVFMEKLVQYKEVGRESLQNGASPPPCSRPLALLAGEGYSGKWVRKKGVAATFLPRYGLLFEDQKGPARLVTADGMNGHKGVDSVTSGIGSLRPANSDNDSDEFAGSGAYKLLGWARPAYFLLDLSRRVALGIAFGAYPRSDQSWGQVSFVFAFTLVQLLYLVLVKPFRNRVVQVVETVSLLCETGLFAAALALLAQGQPANDHLGVGLFMLGLLLTCFVVQLINEWYALWNQLLQLCPNQEKSVKQALKMFAAGFLLPFIPRSRWSRFITARRRPQMGLLNLPSSPEPGSIDQIRRSTSVHHGSPMIAPVNRAGIAVYDPGSKYSFTLTGERLESRPPSDEIPAESTLQRFESQTIQQPSLEGKRSEDSDEESRAQYVTMLEELANARFPHSKQTPSGMLLSIKDYTDDSLSDSSLNGNFSHEAPLTVVA